jgi:hypothetical protein
MRNGLGFAGSCERAPPKNPNPAHPLTQRNVYKALQTSCCGAATSVITQETQFQWLVSHGGWINERALGERRE